MSRYAEGTSVPAERSRAEAEKTLQRYGANGFGYAWDQRVEITPARACSSCEAKGQSFDDCRKYHAWCAHAEKRITREVVLIEFRMKERRVRLEVPMPTEAESGSKAKHEAAVRQRWRALVLVLKAKLEAVSSGISTLEAEFLANVVMPDGRTIGQTILPRLSEAVNTGRLLPAAQDPRP